MSEQALSSYFKPTKYIGLPPACSWSCASHQSQLKKNRFAYKRCDFKLFQSWICFQQKTAESFCGLGFELLTHWYQNAKMWGTHRLDGSVRETWNQSDHIVPKTRRMTKQKLGDTHTHARTLNIEQLLTRDEINSYLNLSNLGGSASDERLNEYWNSKNNKYYMKESVFQILELARQDCSHTNY